MGYESRIYIVQQHKTPGWIWNEIISSIEMCKMGYNFNFQKSFPYELEGTLWIPDYDEEIDKEVLMEVSEDKYGSHLVYGKLDDVIKEVENVMAFDNYWRFNLLLAMLNSFKQFGDNDFMVVYYGH